MTLVMRERQEEGEQHALQAGHREICLAAEWYGVGVSLREECESHRQILP